MSRWVACVSSTDTTSRARELRGRQTSAEEILWEALRNRQLAGLKFRRQHPIGPFVADFCCPDRRLIVEVDGGVHAAQRQDDAQREVLLETAGYLVMRFPNEAIISDLSYVLTAIRTAAEAQRPRSGTPPLRAGGW
jgi:very-short-patch-repair endonuclease